MESVEKRLQQLEYRLGTLERLLEKLAGPIVTGATSELEAAKIETLEHMKHERGALAIAYQKEQIGKLGG